ncbi:Hypothetical_protein [Hexamita inflata]|uniref:Hypothetical_protein n=1 Tax=Hexamita inflata TaxID=28002 RepID=A0AA86UXH0_9EUKA|nr:Hypothetical protein HINF_LOCUS38251 [Hexamita inflata]CAI9952009.1 Hypothetical protein HINF_LOCUS39654 [Hexamita inflata]CAI9952013.1 Hypothetical protein HINF_LOCUS39658 [Hexamita inflata]CAI9952018.1 Hypothetical protein HINF_LOCUS39663 [Hexamita inflata]
MSNTQIARTYEFQYLLQTYSVKRPVTQLLMVHALHNHCRETFQNMTLNDQNSLLAYIQPYNFENDGLQSQTSQIFKSCLKDILAQSKLFIAALNMSQCTEHLTYFVCMFYVCKYFSDDRAINQMLNITQILKCWRHHMLIMSNTSLF